QVRKPNPCRTGSEEEILFIAQLRRLQSGGVDHSSQRDPGRSLDVIVIDAVFVAVALKQVHSIDTGPIFKVNAAFRKDFLDRFDELIDERIELFGRWPGL